MNLEATLKYAETVAPPASRFSHTKGKLKYRINREDIRSKMGDVLDRLGQEMDREKQRLKRSQNGTDSNSDDEQDDSMDVSIAVLKPHC